jgi:hypothetical protein
VTDDTAATDDAPAAAADASEATPDGPDEEQVERLTAALAALDDTALRDAVQGLTEPNRVELASTLQLPNATMHLGNALAPLLRRKIRGAAPQRQLTAAFALTETVNDDMVHALGARHDDPSRDEVLGVLPDVLDRYGAPIVTVLVAAYAASSAVCQPVMSELLETDERLVIGDPVDDGEAAPLVRANTTAGSDADRDARREERKAAKAARRSAQRHQRDAQEAAHAARRSAQRNAKRKAT